MDSTLLAHSIELFFLALVAATIGSLAGLGGGFLVAPCLRIFYHFPPSVAAGMSLIMVTANVLSASIAFLRQGRVLLRLAVPMGLAAIPGSILGAFLVRYAPGNVFDYLYAAILIFLATDLLRRGKAHAEGGYRALPWGRKNTFTDRVTGRTFDYSESFPIALATGFVTGFLSSFFGVGGGILVVPVLLKLFVIPAHVVSASSHMVILFSAPFGVAAHARAGDVDWHLAPSLAAGGLLGGQLGAAISRKLSGPNLVRILAGVLTFAALGLIVSHL